ncbi:hypothetical protein MP228_001467 [Amoeboaphelidium protococcarum]|nr:hypothetical protein MP228_001467 [Amoeboaphelidium protococcarum]
MTRDYAKRILIIDEIIATERSYVNTLLDIQRLFITPLRDAAYGGTPILSSKQIQDIFSNIEDIIKVNTELMNQLNTRFGCPAEVDENAPVGQQQQFIESSVALRMDVYSQQDAIGDIFCYLSPFFKIYSVYVKNYQTAIQLVMELERKHTGFNQFLNNIAKSTQCKGLSFQAYILAPVQRIPRYKLLLEDLLKHTPAEHTDYLPLQKALRSIEGVASFVNEMIREQEGMMKVLSLQRNMANLSEDLIAPGRRFLKQGLVLKVCRKTNKPRALFLFTDILVYAALSSRSSIGLISAVDKKDFTGFSTAADSGIGISLNSQTNINAPSYVFHRLFKLEGMRVVDVQDGPLMQNCFQIISSEKSFAVLCRSEKDKSEWMSAISDAIDKYQSNISTLKKLDSKENELNEDDQQSVYKAPVWVPDNAVISCMQCEKDFSWKIRRHHCRSCGRVICADCSSKKSVLPSKFQEALNQADQRADDGSITGSTADNQQKRFTMASFTSSAYSSSAVYAISQLKPVRVCDQCFDIIDSQLYHLKQKLRDRRSVDQMNNSKLRLDIHTGNSGSQRVQTKDSLIQQDTAISRDNYVSDSEDEADTGEQCFVEIKGRKSQLDDNVELSRSVPLQSTHLRDYKQDRGKTRSMRFSAMDGDILEEQQQTMPSLDKDNESAAERSISEFYSLDRDASSALNSPTVQLKRRSLAWFAKIGVRSWDIDFFNELKTKLDGRIVMNLSNEPQSLDDVELESDQILMSSLVYKRGNTVKSWKLRLLVMTDQELQWYKPEVQSYLRDGGKLTPENLMNKILVKDFRSVSIANDDEIPQSKQFDFGKSARQVENCSDIDTVSVYPFKIVTDERTLYVVCSSFAERSSWIELINQKIHGSPFVDTTDSLQHLVFEQVSELNDTKLEIMAPAPDDLICPPPIILSRSHSGASID